MADDVQISIGVAFDALASGINQAKESLETLSTSVKALAGYFAIREISEFVSSMAELGLQAERTAAILGITTTSAQELAGISLLSGGSADQLTSSLSRLQLGLERGQRATSAQAAAFRAMGISMGDMLKASPDKQIDLLANAVQRLHDQGINAAPALSLINRGLAGLMPMLQGGAAEVDHFRDRLLQVGAIVSTDTTEKLTLLHQELTLVSEAFKGLGETIVAQGAFARFASEVSQAVGNLTALIATGNLVDYVMSYLSSTADKLGAALVKLGFQALQAASLGLKSFEKQIDDADAAMKRADQDLRDLNEDFERITATLRKDIAATATGGLTPIKVPLDSMKNAIKEADLAFKEQEQIINQLYDTFQITELQKTQLLIVEINKRKAAEIKAGEDVKLATMKANADIEKEVTKLTKDLERDWMSAADTIAGAFNSQLRGLLSGTTSWAQAMKNMFASLIESMIAGIVKFAVEWAAQQLFMATVGRGLLAAEAGSFASKLTADAALVFGGVFANLSPVMGPAASGPAAASQAAVLAQLAAIPKFAVGIDYVPRDMFAMVHQGERIVPAEQNTTGGAVTASGSSSINFNVNAIDARSFASMLMDNQSALSIAIRTMMRQNSNLFAQASSAAR